MSVILSCGCKGTTMCAKHEAEWWARHREANARQQQKSAAPTQPIPSPNADLVGE